MDFGTFYLAFGLGAALMLAVCRFGRPSEWVQFRRVGLFFLAYMTVGLAGAVATLVGLLTGGR